MYKKEDPRALRTKEMLKNALLDLLQKGDTIDSLSVQKITQEAQINRTTFYLHYVDIYDLVNKMMDEIVQEMTQTIEELIDIPDLSEQNQFTKLLDYLYSQRQYLLLLFQHAAFEEQLFNLIKRLITGRRENIKKEQNISATKRMLIDVDIRTASLVGIIMWWLKNGLQHSSEHIAQQILLMARYDVYKRK